MDDKFDHENSEIYKFASRKRSFKVCSYTLYVPYSVKFSEG